MRQMWMMVRDVLREVSYSWRHMRPQIEAKVDPGSVGWIDRVLREGSEAVVRRIEH